MKQIQIQIIMSQKFIIKMAEKMLNQQPYINDEELRLSIHNISQIMTKINETVRKSQSFINNQTPVNCVNYENLLTEQLAQQDSQLVQMLKNKVKQMKIPLHQIHKKNKLSTVMQESQSQSGRTNYMMISPRDTDFDLKAKQQRQEMHFQIYSPIKQSRHENVTQHENVEQIQKVTKKITGIRKTSCHKAPSSQSLQNQPPAENKSKPKSKMNEIKNSIFKKSKSVANIKCTKTIQTVCKHKKQVNKQIRKQSNNQINKQCNIQVIDLQNDCTMRSLSKRKKGLSVYSKKPLKSESSQNILCLVANAELENRITTSVMLSSERKAQKGNKTSLTIKKRTITPFMVQKKSCQLDRNDKNEVKTKSSLSRTNLRDFFVSKRIHR